MYAVFLGNVRFPVAPGKITMKIKNQNKTIDLIDGSQVNVLKQAGLTDINFEVLIPQQKYSFANYEKVTPKKYEVVSFRNAKYFLDQFEKMKQKKKPIQFIVWRETGNLPRGVRKNGKMILTSSSLLDTNITVSLEDYEIKEDSENGTDLIVSFSLKKYVSYGTIEVKFEKPKKKNDKPKVSTKKKRDSSSKKKEKTYKVKKGDCLWNLAKKFYDDALQWKNIYDANKKVIEKAAKAHGRSSSSNGYWIYPGSILKLP